MLQLCTERRFPRLDTIAGIDAAVTDMILRMERDLQERVLTLACADVEPNFFDAPAVAMMQRYRRVVRHHAPQPPQVHLVQVYLQQHGTTAAVGSVVTRITVTARANLVTTR